GPDGSVRTTVGQDIVEDRRQQVDRNDHVDVAAEFPAVRVLHMKRADPDQPSVSTDQTGTTPKRGGTCGKHRAAKHVFPITRKFLPSDDLCGDGMTAAPLGSHDRAISGADAQSDSEIDRWDIQSA